MEVYIAQTLITQSRILESQEWDEKPIFRDAGLAFNRIFHLNCDILAYLYHSTLYNAHSENIWNN